MESNQEWKQNQSQQKRTKLLHAERMIEQLNHSISRPKHKSNRFVVDNEYVQNGYLAYLPPICTKLYYALLSHCNTRTQTAFPGIERLQEQTGEKNRNSLITATNILEDYRIIVVHRSVGGSHKSNLYQFVSSKEWLPIEKARGKINIVSYPQRYQKSEENYIKNEEENSGNIDTLTRSSNNYIKDITSQIDLLSKKMQIGSGLAICKPSGNTVGVAVIAGNLRADEHVKVEENCINIDTVAESPSVDNTTQKQRYRGINSDTTIEKITNNMGHTPDDPNIKSAYE